jgi:hypothetical protein
MSTVSETANGQASQIKKLAETFTDTARTLKDRASDVLDSGAEVVRQQAKTYSGRAREQALAARGRLGASAQERPAATAGVIFAAGLGIGLVLAGLFSRPRINLN